MRKRYQHFVITRFNIPVKYEGGKNRNVIAIDPRVDKNYLDRRFQLFIHYTLPSMIGQTNQDFIWLVLFSDQTPDEYKKIINKIKEKCRVFLPCFLTDDEAYDFNKYLSDILNSYDADNFITTRIDNDDAISIKFVEKLQAYCIKEEINHAVLSFSKGIQFTIKSNTLAKQTYLTNHFTTLVAPKMQNNKTIISVQHGLLAKEYKIIEMDEQNPMWLEVIHETNYANKNFLSIKNVVLSTNILKDFSCSITWNQRKIFKNIVWSFLNTIQLIIKIVKSTILKRLSCFMKKK